MNNYKTIVIAADHNGVESKHFIKKYLKELGYSVIDLGPFDPSIKVDYVDYAYQLSTIISNKDADCGILICGTGVGMSIVANRISGVRAVLAHNEVTALKSKEHNNSNVLCLGSWISDEEHMKELVSVWLNNNWEEKRHVKRVERIDIHNGLVMTNGVFDVLHRGHIELLKFSKTQGNKLIVAIDSDSRVKSLKGKDRPINSQYDRKRILEALVYVDEVLIFDSSEELKSFYDALKPNVIVKGSEWTADEVRTRDQIPSFIDVKVYPIVDGYSTTNIVKKIWGLSTCEKI